MNIVGNLKRKVVGTSRCSECGKAASGNILAVAGRELCGKCARTRLDDGIQYLREEVQRLEGIKAWLS